MQRWIRKGQYGYFRRRKQVQAAKSLLVLAGMAVLLAIGYHETHTRNNIMTVLAIVSALPLAHGVVAWLAVLPYHARPEAEYEQVRQCAGDGVFSAELLLTRPNGRSFLVDYAYVHPKGVFLYTSDRTVQEKELAAHLQSLLSGHGLHPSIQLDKQLHQYQARLRALEPVHRRDCPEELLRIEGVLHAVSI